jgi:ATP-dependent RNA circularization protein (DNA/RNA ligase family)
MSKYPRTYHFPFSAGVTNDDRVADTMSNLIGQDIVITEKLDGSNASLVRDGVYGRSHVDFSKNPWDREMWMIHDRIKFDIPDGVFLFGENLEGIHSIEYINLTSYFYIFGIRDNNIWIPWGKVEEYAYLFDIPTVPVLFKGIVNSEKELKELVEKLSKEPSELGGQREGVVARVAGMFYNDDFDKNVIKWVRKGHIQTDAHWTRNWKKAKINIQ